MFKSWVLFFDSWVQLFNFQVLLCNSCCCVVIVVGATVIFQLIGLPQLMNILYHKRLLMTNVDFESTHHPPPLCHGYPSCYFCKRISTSPYLTCDYCMSFLYPTVSPWGDIQCYAWCIPKYSTNLPTYITISKYNKLLQLLINFLQLHKLSNDTFQIPTIFHSILL